MSELLDNRAHRIRTIKEIIRHLHQGQPPAEVKAHLTAIVRECDASDIASMEQELMAEGMPVPEIMGMCDLHSQVVRDLLVERVAAPLPPGHPVDTFRRENEALRAQARDMRAALDRLAPSDLGDAAPVDPERLLECRRVFAGLMDVDKHYRRKENLLFSCLERHGISGPSKVMWGKDDEVRTLLKALGAAVGLAGAAAGEWRRIAQTVAAPALAALEEMIFKEEQILLPMAMQNLTESEWGEIFTQTPEFGYCLVEPGEGYEPAAADQGAPADAVATAARAGIAFAPAPGARMLTMAGPGALAPAPAPASIPGALAAGLVVLPTGALSLEQLKAIFATLPVDVTFVDADDRVRFFSDGRSRVFERPKTIIGRLVQHCHPPSSVDVVERILGDFKSGRQDVAEFWIDFKSRFVHIRYFALRDAAQRYLGTLEVTQDISRERALTGERRLLEYEA